MPKKLMGVREYARHRGVHHRAIQAAIESGRLTPTKVVAGKPRFDPKVSDRELDLSTDPAKQNRKGKRGTSPPPEEKPIDDTPSAARTYANSRAVRETYQARLARLDFEVKSGKLVSADKVKADAYRTARTVRDALLNLPDRIAAQIASLTGMQDARVHDLISGEIRLALEELVNAQKRNAQSEPGN